MAEEGPLLRLKKVSGHDGRQNDMIFCGEDAMQHVILFPGDVQVRYITYFVKTWIFFQNLWG